MACWLGHRWPVGDTGWEIGKDQIGRSNKVRKSKVIKKYRCVEFILVCVNSGRYNIPLNDHKTRRISLDVFKK